MPAGVWKNRLYRMALPFLGMRVQGTARSNDQIEAGQLHHLEVIFRKHHVIGACLQLIQKGLPGPLIAYGSAQPSSIEISEETIFRIASITKMVTAAGAMMLAEKGILHLDNPVDAYLPYSVRNPGFPDTPILIRQLLSHTSSLWDGPGYEQALHSPIPLKTLVQDAGNYLRTAPGECFRYSNLAAGIMGSIMEQATGRSLEELMQYMVFSPLEMHATYTLSNLKDITKVAPIYRVMPPGNGQPLFDPVKRQGVADDMRMASPEYRYLPAAGNLFTDAASLGKFVCMLARGGSPLLNDNSMRLMRTPFAAYGKHAPYARHCLGLVALDDPALETGRLYGHQGFAYGACEGVFVDVSTGNGFVFLNNGASEARTGHLACVNRDLILWALGKKGYLRS